MTRVKGIAAIGIAVSRAPWGPAWTGAFCCVGVMMLFAQPSWNKGQALQAIWGALACALFLGASSEAAAGRLKKTSYGEQIGLLAITGGFMGALFTLPADAVAALMPRRTPEQTLGALGGAVGFLICVAIAALRGSAVQIRPDVIASGEQS